MRNFTFILPLIFFLASAGCIPTSTVKFDLKSGHSIADLVRVEAAIEQLGFTRLLWDRQGIAVPRREDTEKIVSGYEAKPPAFGVSVIFFKGNGAILVLFAERNTNPSTNGTLLSNRIEKDLRSLFGERVERFE